MLHVGADVRVVRRAERRVAGRHGGGGRQADERDVGDGGAAQEETQKKKFRLFFPPLNKLVELII